MTWRVNLPGSVDVVYYLVKLTGLAPFTMKEGRFYPPTFLGKLYPVFIAASYLLFVTMTFTPIVKKRVRGGFSSFIHTWSTMMNLLSLPTIIFTLLMFLLMYKKIVYLLNKLCIVNNALKGLGIKEDGGKFFNNVCKTTVMATTAIIGTCVVTVMVEPHWHTFLSIQYCVNSWFSLTIVLTFVQTLVYIRRYFTLVNEKLFDLSMTVPRLRFSRNSWILVTDMDVDGGNQSVSEDLIDLQRFRKIEALHLELCDLVDRTTHIFAIPIILNTLRLSTQFMVSLYYIYFIFRDSKYVEISTISCTALRMVIAILLLFIIAYVSVVTCKQGNATKTVLFKAWIKFRPLELTNEFVIFTLQLMNTRVAVSAFGFIDLDYSFLFKIFSTVVTYLIVIIQLEP